MTCSANARGEPFHVVAAFEQREHAPAAVARCGFDDAARDLAVRLLGHAHAAERIAAMGVEAGRQQDRLRLIVVDGADDDRLPTLRRYAASPRPPSSGMFSV